MARNADNSAEADNFWRQVKSLRDDESIAKEELPDRLKDAAADNPQLFVQMVDEMIRAYETKSSSKRVDERFHGRQQSSSVCNTRRRRSLWEDDNMSRGRSVVSYDPSVEEVEIVHTFDTEDGDPQRFHSSQDGISDDNDPFALPDLDDVSIAARSVVSFQPEMEAVEVIVDLENDDNASQMSNLSYATQVAHMIRNLRHRITDNGKLATDMARELDEISLLRESSEQEREACDKKMVHDNYKIHQTKRKSKRSFMRRIERNGRSNSPGTMKELKMITSGQRDDVSLLSESEGPSSRMASSAVSPSVIRQDSSSRKGLFRRLFHKSNKSSFSTKKRQTSTPNSEKSFERSKHVPEQARTGVTKSLRLPEDSTFIPSQENMESCHQHNATKQDKKSTSFPDEQEAHVQLEASHDTSSDGEGSSAVTSLSENCSDTEPVARYQCTSMDNSLLDLGSEVPSDEEDNTEDLCEDVKRKLQSFSTIESGKETSVGSGSESSNFGSTTTGEFDPSDDGEESIRVRTMVHFNTNTDSYDSEVNDIIGRLGQDISYEDTDYVLSQADTDDSILKDRKEFENHVKISKNSLVGKHNLPSNSAAAGTANILYQPLAKSPKKEINQKWPSRSPRSHKQKNQQLRFQIPPKPSKPSSQSPRRKSMASLSKRVTPPKRNQQSRKKAEEEEATISDGDDFLFSVLRPYDNSRGAAEIKNKKVSILEISDSEESGAPSDRYQSLSDEIKNLARREDEKSPKRTVSKWFRKEFMEMPMETNRTNSIDRSVSESYSRGDSFGQSYSSLSTDLSDDGDNPAVVLMNAVSSMLNPF